MIIKKNKFQKGFTLIEMIIAVAIFSVVMTVSMESFLNINSTLNRAESFRAINDNLSFVLETMTREIRTGANYQVDAHETGTGYVLSFKNFNNELITYGLDNDSISRKVDIGSYQPLTSTEAKIDKLLFKISEGIGHRKMVTIIINGHSGIKEKEKARFNLQTTVAQRSPKKI